MIPFKYGQAVSGEDFCGRDELLQQLLEFIHSGQNVVLHGERRMGKTSLAIEAARQLSDRALLRVDLMKVKSVNGLCRRLLDACLKTQREDYFLSYLLKQLAHLRPQAGIDPLTGLPTLSLDIKADLPPESLGAILELIQQLHEKKPLLVFIDEFQDLLDLKAADEILALLRGAIQHQGEVPYLFAGSSRHRMEQIFTDPQSPFFKSAVSLQIGPLKRERFVAFLDERFRTGGRQVAPQFWDELFELLDEIPGDVQQLCEALWSTSEAGETISRQQQLADAIALIWARESSAYEIIIGNLTAKQLRVMVALALVGGERVFSRAFLSAADATPSYVRGTLESLIKTGVVHQAQKNYRFFNPFFRAWVANRYR